MAAAQTVKIAVLGAANRFTELVRVFVRNAYRGILVEADQAEVCIIDLDAYGAMKLLQDQRQRHPDRPVIALSLHEPEDKGVTWVKKPFGIEDLRQALECACAPKVKQVVWQETKGLVHRAAAGVGKKSQLNPRLVHPNWGRDADSQYNPADYLQGWLTKAYRQAKLTGIAIGLETGWEPILVYPKLNKIWTSGDDKKLYAFCQVPLKTFARLNGKPVDTPVTIRPEPAAAIAELPKPLQAMDAFLWKVAWWSSGGRLPFGLAPDQPLRLKHWPNLTRYLCPTYAVRLCALLFNRPVTPLEAAELLAIKPAEVFACLSAASALGLIEQVTSTAQPYVVPSAPAKNPGLLRRILQRLVGGKTGYGTV